MSILVTGGSGFVGMNVVEQLIGKGQRVVIVDRNEPRKLALQALRKLDPQLRVVTADVRDQAALTRIFGDFGITRVIHTAVITAGTARESSEPAEILDVNVRGTVSLLQAARAAGCERVVYVSSGAAYGKTHDEGGRLHEEISPSRPNDIYGISKFAAEQTALRLAKLWSLRVVCVRLGSVCGPWEFDTGVRDLLSPQFQVAQLAVRGETALLPDNEPWRDWIYSRDVAGGLVTLLEARDPGYDIYHLSSGIDWNGTFAQLCEALKKAYPRFSWRIAASGERPNISFWIERDRAQMDVARIAQDLNFTPRFGPREAYADYVDWVRKHEDFVAAPASGRTSAGAAAISR